jgi:hypothetical protein
MHHARVISTRLKFIDKGATNGKAHSIETPCRKNFDVIQSMKSRVNRIPMTFPPDTPSDIKQGTHVDEILMVDLFGKGKLTISSMCLVGSSSLAL